MFIHYTYNNFASGEQKVTAALEALVRHVF